MKTNHQFKIWCSVILLCIGGNLVSQDKGGENNPFEPGPSQYFDLLFEGGSLKDFIRHVQEQSPTTINVILPDESDEISVQAIQVRNVSFEEVAKSLEVIADRQWELIQTGNNLWTFYGSQSSEKPVEKPKATLFAYPMSPFLGVFQPDDLITLFTTIWDYTDVPQPDAMTYHEETKMLLVKATEEQDGVMREMIVQLDAGHHVEKQISELRVIEKGRHDLMKSELTAELKKTKERSEAIQEDLTETILKTQEELKEAQAKLAALTEELAKLKSSQ